MIPKKKNSEESTGKNESGGGSEEAKERSGFVTAEGSHFVFVRRESDSVAVVRSLIATSSLFRFFILLSSLLSNKLFFKLKIKKTISILEDRRKLTTNLRI